MTLPVKIGGEHRAMSNGVCLWCGDRWPCETFKLMVRAYFRDRPGGEMLRFMWGFYLRARSHPEFSKMSDATRELWIVGWVPAAIVAEQKAKRAAAAVRTGGQSAVRKITEYAKNLAAGHMTPARWSKPIWHGYLEPQWKPPADVLNGKRHH